MGVTQAKVSEPWGEMFQETGKIRSAACRGVEQLRETIIFPEVWQWPEGGTRDTWASSENSRIERKRGLGKETIACWPAEWKSEGGDVNKCS